MLVGEREVFVAEVGQIKVVRVRLGISPVVVQAGNIGQVYYFQLIFWFLGIALFQIETPPSGPVYYKETFKK